jgi:tagaturonate reductase
MRRLPLTCPRLLPPLHCPPAAAPAPLRVLLYGEGAFLRAFAGPILQALNDQGAWPCEAAVFQPNGTANIDLLAQQGGCYTVLTAGIRQGQAVRSYERIRCLRAQGSAARDYSRLLSLAAHPELQVCISNTTEAGLIYLPGQPADALPATFPARMAAFLHRRFEAFGGSPEAGLVFLPCELVEDNGSLLRECILRHAADWGLGDAFADWVQHGNTFCNTLVDRIVPGLPADAEACWQELGFRDQLLTAAEPWLFWAIEGGAEVQARFPAHLSGYDVVFDPDIGPCRTRKVRILNGAHTALALRGLPAGAGTVREAAEHPVRGPWLRALISDELLPSIPGQAPELLRAYADAVLERFSNPAISHGLEQIAGNSLVKFRTRLLPALVQRHADTGCWPQRILEVWAALLRRTLSALEMSGLQEPPHLLDRLRRHADAARTARPWEDPEVIRAIAGDGILWGPLPSPESLAAALAAQLRS